MELQRLMKNRTFTLPSFFKCWNQQLCTSAIAKPQRNTSRIFTFSLPTPTSNISGNICYSTNFIICIRVLWISQLLISQRSRSRVFFTVSSSIFPSKMVTVCKEYGGKVRTYIPLLKRIVRLFVFSASILLLSVFIYFFCNIPFFFFDLPPILLCLLLLWTC